jgi:RNA binding exosome subunit
LSKVYAAVLNLLPETMRGTQVLGTAEAKGHHGNEITLITLEICDKEQAQNAVGYLIRSLPVGDRLRIRDRIHMFFDGRSTIFFRVDKQQAFLNTVRLSDSDDIIKIKISILSWKADITSVLKMFDLT